VIKLEKISQLLNKTPLKGKIPKIFLKKLKVLNLSFGEYLHYSEKNFKSIFFILDGLVQLKQSTQEGVELNYGFIDKFHFIGERKIIFNSGGNVDFYVLRDNTQILEIPLDIAEQLIKNEKFKIYLLKLHSVKLHELVENISILHFMGTSKFLAHNILKYSIEGIFKFKNMTFLSTILSMDRKSVYNAIKALEREGLIERNGNILKILDNKKLEEYTKL
jgi:CRP-like cAMP-binding protein